MGNSLSQEEQLLKDKGLVVDYAHSLKRRTRKLELLVNTSTISQPSPWGHHRIIKEGSGIAEYISWGLEHSPFAAISGIIGIVNQLVCNDGSNGEPAIMCEELLVRNGMMELIHSSRALVGAAIENVKQNIKFGARVDPGLLSREFARSFTI
jgi:hypothetical protein